MTAEMPVLVARTCGRRVSMLRNADDDEVQPRPAAGREPRVVRERDDQLGAAPHGVERQARVDGVVADERRDPERAAVARARSGSTPRARARPSTCRATAASGARRPESSSAGTRSVSGKSAPSDRPRSRGARRGRLEEHGGVELVARLGVVRAEDERHAACARRRRRSRGRRPRRPRSSARRRSSGRRSPARPADRVARRASACARARSARRGSRARRRRSRRSAASRS